MFSGLWRTSASSSSSSSPLTAGQLTEDKADAIKPDAAPPIPPRPTEEELRHTIAHRLNPIVNPPEDDAEDGAKEECTEERMRMKDEEETKPTDDAENGAKEECTGERMRIKDEEETKPTPKKNVQKKKNPFMPHVAVKGKVIQKKSKAETVEKKSLMEQLNELQLERTHLVKKKDLESLMEWWSTVEQWEPTFKDENMTEKEEAKAFAVTAERVQRGIRVFNQLYMERAEALWQHVIDLHAIADGLDRFNWRTKVAQITGGSTSAVGGVATIAGLALAPVTMGTSLIVTAVGLGVATAGGLTSASAGISNAVHDSMDRKKVERIVQDFQSKMADIDKCTRFIKRGVENLKELSAPRVKKLKAYDFPTINNVYEDGAMASKAVLINAREIARVTQVAMASGGTAARAVQIASMATGVLSGLFVAMDVYFVAKDSRELKKGAKSEFARKIREVAEQLQEGLVELNSIREELHSTGSSTSNNDTTSSTPSSLVSGSTLTFHSSDSDIPSTSSTSVSNYPSSSILENKEDKESLSMGLS